MSSPSTPSIYFIYLTVSLYIRKCLFIYLYIYVSLFLSIYLSIYLSAEYFLFFIFVWVYSHNIPFLIRIRFQSFFLSFCHVLSTNLSLWIQSFSFSSYLSIYLSIYLFGYLSSYLAIYPCLFIFIYLSLSLYIYVCVCVCVFASVCVCVRERERERERESLCVAVHVLITREVIVYILSLFPIFLCLFPSPTLFLYLSLYIYEEISFQIFFVWALLLIVHTWNFSPLRINLLRLQYACSTVPTTSGRPHGIPLVWACQSPSSWPLSSPQLSHNDSLWA